MRLSTRTFTWSFLPAAALLIGSFWTVQRLVISTVKDDLRSSLRDNQLSIARIAARAEQGNGRVLRIAGENPALKAGLQLLRIERNSRAARLTAEDQLREIGDMLGFDVLMISDPHGRPLLGLIRSDARLVEIDFARVQPPLRGFFSFDGVPYSLTSVPINQGDENIGFLTAAEHLSLADFRNPVVLSRHGRVLQSTLPGISHRDIESALRKCGIRSECEVRFGDESFLSIGVEGVDIGDGYSLRSFQSLDAASRPVQASLRKVFLISASGGLLLALVLGAVASRSIVRPITGVISQLRQSERTGVLPEFPTDITAIQEIGELTEAFNRASVAIRASRERLEQAYVEFVGSLASALDARDPYTAGHSSRVSEFSCAIAKAMHAAPKDLNEIRIGALLHDVGKIGIADSVLQKPGKLTGEEFDLIKKHPTIGRRILERVNGLHRYLPIVELHHEHWDGSGYPRGLRGTDTPWGARIVHVADAYDAMTSDRPYRKGMDQAEAIRRLRAGAGTQFDPDVVTVFAALLEHGALSRDLREAADTHTPSLGRLAKAVLGHSAAVQAPVPAEVEAS